ncbi:homocysteine-responsive endoplasmic reticulum-resident ubiquitin-like domain member 1 protein [Takifugu flavidus]|uniref:homocysteine-responsive endoplasmic reticulum-resident ubiquitin-like domain member 1 protein n=1 Tax=Takifugu flavidus TaxID=433684 RepID=UPI0025441AC3|nr:homocysteine-responsive endoplasmic reticulum-resident ubiquitin-like domain member 1 protein [Takifugu flavidus]
MDSDNSQQTTIRIIIKTPNQAYKDQTIDGVHLNWTVKELKMHLSAVYPSRPPVSGQRLIYAGKLLLDHLPLEDLFKQIDITPSLHLVCALGNRHQELGARSKTKVTEQVQPSSSSSGTPELRQRRQTSPSLPPASAPTHTPGNPPSPAMPGAQQMTQPAFPSYSLYSPQQLLWLQHIYAQQYYMQYHAALAAARSDSSTPASTVGQYPPVPAHHLPVPAPLGNQNPINDLPVNPNPVQEGAFLNPAEANNNLRLNAQGGAVMEDEEDVEHDWLDWLYSAARVGVLLMIVYFNSNLSRFLLVMGTLFLMYLHTAGWFPFRRQVRVQEPNHQQPPEVQPNQQNENQNPNQAGEPAEGRPAAPPEASEGLTAAVLVPPHRVSLMWTAWVFFKSFFSSLIPEGPQGMAN